VIPGIEPGEATAAHIDRVVSYTTCIGAVYLAAIFLMPEVLIAYTQKPFIWVRVGSDCGLHCT